MKFPGNVGLRERLYFGDVDDSREPLIINNLLCYLTIHTRESEVRNIFEGFFYYCLAEVCALWMLFYLPLPKSFCDSRRLSVFFFVRF